MEISYEPRIKPLIWHGSELLILDQTKLPHTEEYIIARDHETVAKAIEAMQVRGAPAIGIAAAYAVVLGAKNALNKCSKVDDLVAEVKKVCDRLRSTRPTAVNLFWALDRMLARLQNSISETSDLREVVTDLEEEAKAIHEEEFRAELEMSKFGAKLLHDGDTVLTHCNAGGLATGTGLGTALGVIKLAYRQGKDIKVIATETRPVLQGARLTVYELVKEGIPTTLITDNMVGYVMYRGLVDCVIVGADRVLRDGHVINKIGTYTIAVLAHEHGVPFYVAAPRSSFDLKSKVNDVVIEERSEYEVKYVMGMKVTLDEVGVMNPAFDITPPKYVSAIITEYGVIRPPFSKNIGLVLGGG
ncbi:MAG: S-methyl-5-thioribose-1-phosphate isomerase [Thermoprotei archaeon]|nr:MAG: S-methyl-5-thioribose-1-phosphate isomerase [Thermoprotei archaeon]